MPRKRRWGEGHIKVLPNGRARVRWYEGGPRLSKNFASRALAEVFLRGRVGDIAREQAGLAPDPKRFPALEKLAAEWIERRKHTHRSWSEDRGRWTHHLAPHFGRLRPADVDVAAIRSFAEARLRARMNRATLRLCIACLSSFMTDLAERPRETGLAANPCLRLPKNLRRLWKSEHDPRFTPYVERLADVRRIFQAMPEPQRVAYAVGITAGLRPGELLALEWESIHERDHRIDVRWQVQDGRRTPNKDDEARIIQGPFLAPLWPVLAAWKAKGEGTGLLFPPALLATPKKRVGAFLHPRRLAEGLAAAAEREQLPAIMEWNKPWYQATRHTMATHWMRAGHSLGELALVLGHASTWVTERYAHIRPGPEREDPWAMDLLAVEVAQHGPKTGPKPRQPKRPTKPKP